MIKSSGEIQARFDQMYYTGYVNVGNLVKEIDRIPVHIYTYHHIVTVRETAKSAPKSYGVGR